MEGRNHLVVVVARSVVTQTQSSLQSNHQTFLLVILKVRGRWRNLRVALPDDLECCLERVEGDPGTILESGQPASRFVGCARSVLRTHLQSPSAMLARKSIIRPFMPKTPSLPASHFSSARSAIHNLTARLRTDLSASSVSLFKAKILSLDRRARLI